MMILMGSNLLFAMQDEFVRAAAWIYRATQGNWYLEYVSQSNPGGARGSLSWDDKYVSQVLISKVN